MAAPGKLIRVPNPERGSYNPDRPAGSLLRAQALHIHEALLQHLLELASVLAVNPASLKTEGEIGNYIGRATALLHTRAPRKARK